MDIPKEFNTKYQHRRDGEEILIFPGPHMHHYRWKNYQLRWLRSMHIDAETKAIISCGLPKFMSLGTGVEQYSVSTDDISKAKDLIATKKIDGTCLIRYVMNGKVKWRTKQSFYIQLENDFEIDEFLKQYPKLSDPSFCADLTLIFEWVSPFNQIIVKYDEPGITLIGAIKYTSHVPWYKASINLLQIQALTAISEECGVHVVENFGLRKISEINFFIDQVHFEEYQEGYVLRFNNEQQLVKIKSNWWLLAFACKISYTTAMAAELWIHWDKPKYQEYCERFQQTFDKTMLNKALPVISAMYNGVKRVQGIVHHIEEFCRNNSNLSNVEFNELAESQFTMLRLEICQSIRKKHRIADAVWKKLILQHCTQTETSIVS